MGRWGKGTLVAKVGQLLSSHGISGCDHALELPNGVIRRPLDAPLKQAVTLVVYSSQWVFVTMTVDSPDTLSSRNCNRSVTQTYRNCSIFHNIWDAFSAFTNVIMKQPNENIEMHDRNSYVTHNHEAAENDQQCLFFWHIYTKCAFAFKTWDSAQGNWKLHIFKVI